MKFIIDSLVPIGCEKEKELNTLEELMKWIFSNKLGRFEIIPPNNNSIESNFIVNDSAFHLLYFFNDYD